MEITALQFEEMIDRLEKGSGQQVFVSFCGEKCWLAWYLHKHHSGSASHRGNKPTKSDSALLCGCILFFRGESLH